MKVARLLKYSNSEINLSIDEVEKPEPKATEVLVKISAAGINPLDFKIIDGTVRFLFPYSFPLAMGNEFVGKIESIGEQVTKFKVGDRVYARTHLDHPGAFAEYIAIDQKEVALAPDYLNDEEAAGVPLTALTAYQALELLKAKEGETLFISGGSGGFGSMAIPIAKARGLKVITSGSAMNKERVMALGCDQYIDYKTEDYSKILKDVDCIIDTIGKKELEKEFSILKKGGSIVSLDVPNKAFGAYLGLSCFKQFLLNFVGWKWDKLAEKNGQKYFFIFVESNGEQLAEITRIFSERKVKVSVDKVFEFSDVNKAIDKVKNGRSQGKTILKIN